MDSRQSRHNVWFDAETMQVLSDAFDHACNVLGHLGNRAAMHEILARRIVEAATIGERDPARLSLQALNAMGIDKSPVDELAA